MHEIQKTILEACNLQQSVGLQDSKVPVLVGKTSSGKTYWIQNVLSKELNLPVVKILLQNEQPDEILGYPKFMGQDKLEFLKPAWWTDKPSIYFFDELDKSREELHASILTLMREGTIRGRHLPKGSVIVAAMNETEYLSDPLKARCLFLPFSHTRRTHDDSILEQAAEYLQSNTLPPVLPDQVSIPENLHYIAKFQTFNPNLLQDKPKVKMLLTGLYPDRDLLPMLNILCGLDDIHYHKLIKDTKLFNNFLSSITSVYDGHKHFIELLKIASDSYDHVSMLDQLVKKFSSSNAEDLVKFYELTHDAWLNDIPNIGNHVFNDSVVRNLAHKLRDSLAELTCDIDDKLTNLNYKFDDAEREITKHVTKNDTL